jgi:hypothetical protein
MQIIREKIREELLAHGLRITFFLAENLERNSLPAVINPRCYK